MLMELPRIGLWCLVGAIAVMSLLALFTGGKGIFKK